MFIRTICDGNEFQIFITRFEKKVCIPCGTTIGLFELSTVVFVVGVEIYFISEVVGST